MKTLVAAGAYGRKATMADWLAGKSFIIVGGCYFSIRDAELLKTWHDEIVFIADAEGREIFRVTL